MANLLQELKLALDGKETIIGSDHIFENPVARISRSIRELYWAGLTRRIGAKDIVQNLELVLEDSKIPRAEFRHLYVPAADQTGLDYFTKISRDYPKLKLKVWSIPREPDAKYLEEMSHRQGLLSLGLEKSTDGTLQGVAFIVPGGRFNEMYGWDSYFEALGLIHDGKTDLARGMVDNFVYEIENYGKILNANRTYYLNRSQPPFLTSMISAVYSSEKSPSKEWLKKSINAAMTEYFSVWLNPERKTETGLSRYYGNGKGIPPEVEKGHFDYFLKPAAKAHKMSVAALVRDYNSGALKDTALDDFFAQDRAVRESGHDTTYRWRVNGKDRAADFVTVDLNSLLYKAELDFAKLVKTNFNDRFDFNGKNLNSQYWLEQAKSRKELMLKYLWDNDRKVFTDYNFKSQTRSTYISSTSFYPLWVSNDPAIQLLPEKDAQASVRLLLQQLELPGGLSGSSEESLKANGDPKNPRQWDYPNGWAPHQIIAWGALNNYGLKKDEERLIYKWLFTVTKNAANYNGTITEKIDVLHRSHAVFAEYGNVGTQFSVYN